MFDFLESLDITNKGKWFKILLAPIWLLLEYLCYIKIWKRTIVPELISSDKIFNFLNDNEFGHKHGKFIKKDLIDENEFFVGRSLKEVKQLISKEFAENISKLVSEECNFNIEEFTTLQVICDTQISIVNDEARSHRVYEIYIMYCRHWWLNKARKYSYIWSAVVLSIIGVILTIINL